MIEAMVWVATSDDAPGLATEAVTMEDLIEKLKVMIPELLMANMLSLRMKSFRNNNEAFELTQRVARNV